MDIKNLDEQIALVRHHSLKEFRQYIEEFALKEKAVQMLFNKETKDGLKKFEAYIEKYEQLPVNVERALLETRRDDLQAIYFAKCSCHKKNESLIVRNTRLFLMYYKDGRIPSESAQVELIRSRSKAIWPFMSAKFCFCSSALNALNKSAPPQVRRYYYKLHSAPAG